MEHLGASRSMASKRKKPIRSVDEDTSNTINADKLKRYKNFDTLMTDHRTTPTQSLSNGTLESINPEYKVLIYLLPLFTTDIYFNLIACLDSLPAIKTLPICISHTNFLYDHIARRLISKYPNVSYLWQFFTTLA